MSKRQFRPSRRLFLGASAAISASLALPHPSRAKGNDTLQYRGVIYDTGTDIGYPGYLSRMSWHDEDVRRELAAIHEQLHCNTIQIVGTDLSRLRAASTVASALGLTVWLQPRLFEQDAQAQLSHMANAARLAATLAEEGVDIVFSVGCETSLFQKGLVAGETFAERLGPLLTAKGEAAEQTAIRLNRFLREAVDLASSHFSGQLSYSAGSWERVDWTPFDIVGVNLYRDQRNHANYREVLRGHMDHDKPLVVTEFGCSTFEGAGQYGAGGFQIVDYTTLPPSIPEQFVRSEREQAREIVELLSIFEQEGISGAFVYNFLSQFDAYSDDPRRDLDTASHAIVKTMPGKADEPLTWEPKAAFHAIAEVYRDQAAREDG